MSELKPLGAYSSTAELYRDAQALERERVEPAALKRAWSENKCGDDECEEYRLKAAIMVLTGGTTHKENADKLYAAPAPSQDMDAKRFRDWLESQVFYELCQSYRHAKDWQFEGMQTASEAFEELKRSILATMKGEL